MIALLYCGLAIEVFGMGYAVWIVRTYNDKLVSACAEVRRNAYALGYEDGRYDVKGGSK